MLRRLRIIALLLVLLFVALGSWLDRVYSTDWRYSLLVAIYPIDADGSDAAADYIDRLTVEDFRALEDFFESEAREYGVTLERPVKFTLAPRLDELPPKVEPGAGMIEVMLWSLRARYWAWRAPDPPGPAPDIDLFVLYHDPERSPTLPHSLGLQKGLFGIVHVFADRRMKGSNDTVLAHELLHTLGATDKYALGNNQPRHPDGYAEPDLDPLYPQRFAELMGGRIPLSQAEARTPESLSQVLIGPATAAEIGWSDAP